MASELIGSLYEPRDLAKRMARAETQDDRAASHILSKCVCSVSVSSKGVHR